MLHASVNQHESKIKELESALARLEEAELLDKPAKSREAGV